MRDGRRGSKSSEKKVNEEMTMSIMGKERKGKKLKNEHMTMNQKSTVIFANKMNFLSERLMK